MQHEGREESEEASSPDVHESTLHGDVVRSLTRPYNGMKLAVTGCSPHYLLLWEWPELLIDLFPMMHANTRFRQIPTYDEVQKGFKRGCIEAQRPSKNERDRPRINYDIFISTVQLMPGDVDWTKANPFQGKRKIDCRWDEVEYEIACQVTNGSPLCETKDSSGKVKAPHRNRFFLVATPQGASTALCQKEYANVDPTICSALGEFTPLECDIDLLRNIVEERLSRRSTSFSPCGQVDGIRRPLFEVVPSTATKDNRDGRRDECASDDEPHWVPPVYFQACNLNPNLQLWTGGGERLHVTGVLTLGPGLVPFLFKANLVPGRLSMGGHSLS